MRARKRRLCDFDRTAATCTSKTDMSVLQFLARQDLFMWKNKSNFNFLSFFPICWVCSFVNSSSNYPSGGSSSSNDTHSFTSGNISQKMMKKKKLDTAKVNRLVQVRHFHPKKERKKTRLQNNPNSALFRWSETIPRDQTLLAKQELRGPEPPVSWLGLWRKMFFFKTAAVRESERNSWRWPPVWLPHRSPLPLQTGKQDSARVQCFMSWSRPNSPHSHKRRAGGRDSGHAAAAARPQGACAQQSWDTHARIYVHMQPSEERSTHDTFHGKWPEPEKVVQSQFEFRNTVL